VLPLLVFQGWTWLSPFADAALAKAKVAEGQLSWYSEREEYMNSAKSIGKMYLTKYELLVGGQRLLVSKTAQSFIPEGGPYRVFFAPLSRTVVNIEAMPGWSVKGTNSTRRDAASPSVAPNSPLSARTRLILAVVLVAIIAALALGGWWFWDQISHCRLGPCL
jgi:hypothetical protein